MVAARLSMPQIAEPASLLPMMISCASWLLGGCVYCEQAQGKESNQLERQDAMTPSISRRDLLKAASVGAACLTATTVEATQRGQAPGWVTGHMSGADALVETLIAEGTDCVYGIP